MLTKQQARIFFLGGTAVVFLIFLGLSWHSLATGIPEHTNDDKLTEAVAKGKLIWDRNNCMGCHTILGEGAYYAPELTKVYDRRGPDWIKIFMKDPQAMFPNERKMQKYDLSEEDLENLVEFFQWIGEIDLNGFPAEPDLKPVTTVVNAPTSTIPQPEKFKTLCIACHAVAGSGGNVGPALDGVATRYETEYLTKWISNPPAVKPGTAMPKLPLSDGEINELVSYLSTLK